MKLNRLLLFFLLFMFGCSSDKEPPEIINPIELFPSSAILGSHDLEDHVTITNGNGGYKIFYPKIIYISEPIDPSEPLFHMWYEYDFQKEKIRVSIVDNILYFEGNIPEGDPNFYACFLIADSKGQKKIIQVFAADYLGGRPKLDRETELQLLNNPDYWQK